ncbi:MAG: hypothetical protein IJW46_02230 [Clostridia bacterium]|nr:hypothetical protein [Clostridia bacterium]
MNNQKKLTVAIVLLSILLLLVILVTVLALFLRKPTVLPPDYPPQDTDSNMQPIPGDSGGTIETPEGGGAVNITYADTVTVSLSDRTASLYYANPSRSNQNVAIAVMIGSTVILRSDLITPGNMVTTLPLVEGVEEQLLPGGYQAELIIYCYHPETGEKAMIDTRGTLTLTVVESKVTQ